MNIKFACNHCKRKLEVDETQAGKEVTCPHCHKITAIPEIDLSQQPPGKLRLKGEVHKQVYENMVESGKICPKCNASSDARAIICISCGFNFVAGKVDRKKGSRLFGWLFGTTARFVFRLLLLAVLVAAGFVGFVWFQNARFAQQNRDLLEQGHLDSAAENFRKLASYYRWFEYVKWPNPYELRYRQFQARAGKTYEQTKNPKWPLVVLRSVWGNKNQINMKVGWVKFSMVNLDGMNLPVGRRMFLLMGLDNNLAFANEAQKEDPQPITLKKGEGVTGYLYFGGIVKQPAFLEFNNGFVVVRAPTYINYAMDNYDRDHRDWPSGKAAEEFPMLKRWEESRMTPAEVHQLWQAYSKMPAPEAEPYTTVLREQNPR